MISIPMWLMCSNAWCSPAPRNATTSWRSCPPSSRVHSKRTGPTSNARRRMRGAETCPPGVWPRAIDERIPRHMRLASYPRFPLVTGPTPLQRATRLENALGPQSPRIYIKRDDLTGLAYGGNKARKLEYLVADALKQGATVLVTEGVTQSNHARMTAAAAVLAGLKCVLILDARNGADEQGNLLLDRMLGADVRIVAGRDERIAAMKTIGEELRATGETPYVIPTGGSVPLGSLGYVHGVLELESQLLDLAEVPKRVYFPNGS